jgi:hypothetical protein
VHRVKRETYPPGGKEVISHITTQNREAQRVSHSLLKNKKNRTYRLHGANGIVHPDRTANSAVAGHHLTLPLHQPPPHATPAQEFEEDCVGPSTSYLQTGKEKRVRGTCRWGREGSARGRCSPPDRSKSSFLPLVQIEVGLQLLHLKATKIYEMSSEMNC